MALFFAPGHLLSCSKMIFNLEISSFIHSISIFFNNFEVLKQLYNIEFILQLFLFNKQYLWNEKHIYIKSRRFKPLKIDLQQIFNENNKPLMKFYSIFFDNKQTNRHVFNE
jgi:hypothetical protein